MWLTDDPNEPANAAVHSHSANNNSRPHNAAETGFVGSIATEVLNEWWQHHPLNASGRLAGAAARGIVEPLVRRHPAIALGTAAAAGALLVRSRAWRWVLRRALLVGAASQIASRFISRAADQVDKPAGRPQPPQHFKHDS